MGDERPDETSDSHEDESEGRPDYHNPLKGVAGAAPAYSALTLRLVLAGFGLVVSAIFAVWVWVVDGPALGVAVLALFALIAAVDLAVVVRRKRRGEPG
jgi:hypothetical protein